VYNKVYYFQIFNFLKKNLAFFPFFFQREVAESFTNFAQAEKQKYMNLDDYWFGKMNRGIILPSAKFCQNVKKSK